VREKIEKIEIYIFNKQNNKYRTKLLAALIKCVCKKLKTDTHTFFVFCVTSLCKNSSGWIDLRCALNKSQSDSYKQATGDDRILRLEFFNIIQNILFSIH